MTRPLRPFILGITGGIACGKSLVTEIFRHMGATIVSADQLAREAVAPGTKALRQLTEQFGIDILTSEGVLNRTILANKVFSDPQQRLILNQIMHPVIAEMAEQRLRELAHDKNCPLIVYEAPLLFEAHAESRVDAVLVISASEALQTRRLCQRDGLSRAEALQRIHAQMPLQEKIARANWVIDNSGSIVELTRHTEALYRDLMTKKIPRDGGFLKA